MFALRLRDESFVEPLEDSLVVRHIFENEVMTAGGIVLPVVPGLRPVYMGLVLACGPGRLTPDGSQRIPIPVKPQDAVLFRRGSEATINVGMEERLIIKASDIVARVKPREGVAEAPSRSPKVITEMVVPVDAVAEVEDALRRIEVWNGHEYRLCRMSDLRETDLFRTWDDGDMEVRASWQAVSPPSFDKTTRVWGIEVTQVDDPAGT